jgi:uncharacterized protein with ParB-like and HNH nuclease domain
MSTLLKQAQPTFGELCGNGKTYEVPPFQRDYSWDKEEWEDLWFDLIALEQEGDHYMGYLVLQETKEPKKSIIIDGQQRITTISLLILSAVQYLKERGDIQRSEDLKKTYLSSRDLVRQIEIPKLKLNYNNEYIYGGKLMQFDLPDNTVGLKPSEKRLIGAYKYFLKKISEEFNQQTTESVTEFITRKIDIKLFFTSITVKDDINAFKVFETLNARGVKLSTADLLKNFLFSIIYTPNAGSITQEEKKWHRINDILGKTDVTTFLRHFWNARNYPGERKSTLFKTFKNAITSQAEAIQLLNDLDNSVNTYVALESPQNEIWTTEQSKLIEELNILDVSQCYPLLMMAKMKWAEIEFNKLLRDIIAISFRYNTIGGQNPNELERIYGRASLSIFKGETNTARGLYQAFLKDAYLENESFKHDFSQKIINTQKYNGLVKYILSKLEVQYGGNEPELNSKQLSVEHILPESPTEEWANNFQGVDIENYIYRIGNLTLLEANKNRLADRRSYEEKKSIYLTSNYHLSSQTLNSEEWVPKSILDRQRELANRALTIWKVNY